MILVTFDESVPQGVMFFFVVFLWGRGVREGGGGCGCDCVAAFAKKHDKFWTDVTGGS